MFPKMRTSTFLVHICEIIKSLRNEKKSDDFDWDLLREVEAAQKKLTNKKCHVQDEIYKELLKYGGANLKRE